MKHLKILKTSNRFIEELLPDDIPAAHDEFNNYDLGNENDIFELLGHENNDSDSENEIRYERRDDDDDDNDDRPLYLGVEITKRESMLSLLSVSLKHNLNTVCVEDIIRLLEMHCLSTGLIKNSLYKFKKYFNIDDVDSKKHFYCSSCNQLLTSENDISPTCKKKKKKCLFCGSTGYKSYTKNVWEKRLFE